MKGIYKIELFGEKLDLLPQKAIYYPQHKTLLAADLHLGKAGHFRNAGIAVPVTGKEQIYVIADADGDEKVIPVK